MKTKGQAALVGSHHNTRIDLKLRAIWAMSKPAVGLLVAVTAIPAMMFAPGGMPHVTTSLSVIVGILLTSCAGAIFNQLIDMDIDYSMARTKKRPLVTGDLKVEEGLWIAALMQLAATVILFFGSSPLAAAVGLIGNAFYLLGYTTYLKRKTDQNIVIGGAAGAVGPLIGWAAVTGDLSVAAWLMFALVFFWTPSHFWALCLNYIDDYRSAAVPMLPVVRGEKLTRRWIMYYAWTLVPIIWGIHYSLGGSSLAMFINLAAVLGYVAMSVVMWLKKDSKLAMPLFHYSCVLLFLNFAVITIDRLLYLS